MEVAFSQIFWLLTVIVIAVFISAAVYNYHRHSLRRQQRLHRQCQFDFFVTTCVLTV